MNDMKRFRLPMASGVLLAVWVATVGATEGPAPMPVAGGRKARLSRRWAVCPTKAWFWSIDRADSNAPVLDARLEVEANGQTQEPALVSPRAGRLPDRRCRLAQSLACNRANTPWR